MQQKAVESENAATGNLHPYYLNMHEQDATWRICVFIFMYPVRMPESNLLKGTADLQDQHKI